MLDRSRFAKGAAFVAAAFIVLQSAVVILHEHVHSTIAWALGYTSTPFTVVWGNPITVTGWDEGVPYDRLFPHPGNPAEAAIGVAPLLMHAIFVALGIWLMLRPRSLQRPLTFLILYCFVAINLAELTAYLVMRPFAPNGDTGHFRRGLNISPLFLFVVGSVMLFIALYFYSWKVGARLTAIVQGSQTARWLLVIATGFLIFLWDSGLRMMMTFPNPQWVVGLIGFPALVCWIAANAFSSKSLKDYRRWGSNGA